ncbi:MAG: PCMD domain-containing protein [Candidatus Cryptobacteroides sp.]
MKIRTLTICLAAAVLMASCKDNMEPGLEGALCLSVQTQGDTKAAMSSEELLATADVRIYKADFSGMVRHYSYSQMPAEVYLPSGDYRIDVLAGEAAKESPSLASWEQKSYKGTADVTIEPSKSKSVTVAATVSNAISNIVFDASVAQYFEPGFTCKVSLKEDFSDAVLVYDSSLSGSDGYFIISGFEPSLYWSFSGTLKDGATSVTKSGEISAVEAAKRYNMSLKYVEKNGIVDVVILVDETTNDIYDDIVFVPVSTGISASSRYETWAGHFTAHADVDEAEYDPAQVYFEYRVKGTEDWTRSAAATRESEGSFSAVLSSLTPGTEYEYRLVLYNTVSAAEEIVESISTFTTDVATQAPNSSFETVSKTESSNYYSFYDPSSSDPSLQTKWWCSGNKGSTTVGSSYQITYPDTSDKKDGNQSVCLESRYVIVKFAAGNLFAGRFGETIGTSGGTVYFGRPFTARPTAMRLWCKYSGGTINRYQDNAPSEVAKGDYDKASLRIALGTWDYKTYGGDANSPILVNTTDESTFVDFTTDASTIAFGEKIIVSDEANSTNVWQQITIPLEYRNLNKYPTHIMISFAASMYGDYFTGCDSSKLWIDAVELLYE